MQAALRRVAVTSRERISFMSALQFDKSRMELANIKRFKRSVHFSFKTIQGWKLSASDGSHETPVQNNSNFSDPVEEECFVMNSCDCFCSSLIAGSSPDLT